MIFAINKIEDLEKIVKKGKHIVSYGIDINEQPKTPTVNESVFKELETSPEKIKSINAFTKAIFQNYKEFTFERVDYSDNYKYNQVTDYVSDKNGNKLAPLFKFYNYMNEDAGRFYRHVKELYSFMNKPAFKKSKEGTFIIETLEQLLALENQETQTRTQIEKDGVLLHPNISCDVNISIEEICKYRGDAWGKNIVITNLAGYNEFLQTTLTKEELEPVHENLKEYFSNLTKYFTRSLEKLGQAMHFKYLILGSESIVHTTNNTFKKIQKEVSSIESITKKQSEIITALQSEKNIMRYIEQNPPIHPVLVAHQEQLHKKYVRKINKFSNARKDFRQILRYVFAWHKELKDYRELKTKGYPITFGEISEDNTLKIKKLYPHTEGLLWRHSKNKVSAYDIEHTNELRLITGPNQGGKTIFLSGLLNAYLHFKSGLPVVAQSASFPLYDGVFEHTTESTRNESTLANSVQKYTCILKTAKECTNPLFMMDELASGTDFEDIKTISERVIRALHQYKASANVVTQFNEVINLAVDKYGAKPYVMKNYSPQLGIGQANGVALADKLGLSDEFIDSLNNKGEMK